MSNQFLSIGFTWGRLFIILAVVMVLSGCFTTATPTPVVKMATPLPTLTATPQAVMVAAEVMAPTPLATQTPTAKPSTATPTVTATTPISSTPTTSVAGSPVKSPASAVSMADKIAQPLSPADGMVFNDASGTTEILLTWSPVKPELADNEYYVATLQYKQLGQTETDRAETKNTSWLVNEHSYLRGLADDGLFYWSVTLVRQTGTDASGAPVEELLSQAGPVWAFVWQPVQSVAAPVATATPQSNNSDNTNDNNDNDNDNDNNDNDNDNNNDNNSSGNGGNDGSGGIGFPSYP